MRRQMFVTTCLLLVGICLLLGAVGTAAQQNTIVIAAATVLDGRGHALHNTRIVVRDGKIAAIDPKAAPVTYDLGQATVMPGLIDAHVHISWHFGPDGRADTRGETPAQGALADEGNAWATLLAGFTTVQSVGAAADKDLRDAISRAVVPGPRILTSLTPITNGKLTPEQLRAAVRKLKADGADLVKVFASKSIREGGGPTMTEEQLAAICGEARAAGLRVLVHAYRASVGDATRAGCTQVEHGTFASDDDLRLMAQRGVYFDPQVRLVIQNYLDNKARFLGIGNYTEEGFRQMEEALPLEADLFRRALKTPGLKVVFGTDAVAGAHGRNAEEIIYRVHDGGQAPMDAIVSATSLAAESLGLGHEIGALAPGMQADIVAVEGDPLRDITALRRMVFVMRKGTVYKNVR